jgi:adenylate cyclase class IV
MTSRQNVELKARDADLARTLRRCLELATDDQGVLRQRDSYFGARDGRLKLREQEPGPSYLIHYRREDKAELRPSEYTLVEIADPPALARLLASALGIECVVGKERRLFLWEQNVRIHLDRVDGLGTFVEIEAVAPPDSNLARERDQAERLRALLEIESSQLVPTSYSDLLRGHKP